MLGRCLVGWPAPARLVCVCVGCLNHPCTCAMLQPFLRAYGASRRWKGDLSPRASKCPALMISCPNDFCVHMFLRI